MAFLFSSQLAENAYSQPANYKNNAVIAQNSPSDPAIAAVEKSGRQVVTLRDGSKLTFAKFAEMSPKEQDAVIEEISDEEADRLERHLRPIKNGVIQKQQEALEEFKRLDAKNKEVISALLTKVPQVVPLYELDIANGKKLSSKEMAFFKFLLNL